MFTILATMFTKLCLLLKTLLPLNSLAMAAIPTPFSQAGRSVLQRVSVDLTSAQILTLLGTPITLVPAQGAGLQIVPVLIVTHFFGGSVAYTNAGGAVNVKVGPTMLQALTEQFITTVAPNRTVGVETFGGTELQSSAGNPPDTDNVPLTINKITNNYAAGNGTARFTAYYFVEPTA